MSKGRGMSERDIRDVQFMHTLLDAYVGICDQLSISGELGWTMRMCAHTARRLEEKKLVTVWYSRDDRMGKIYKATKKAFHRASEFKKMNQKIIDIEYAEL